MGVLVRREEKEPWLNYYFPRITERAEKENAEIFFEDEMNIQNIATYAI